MVSRIGLGLAIVLVLVTNVVPALLRGLLGPHDGDDIARHSVEIAADELRDSPGYWTEATDAETPAAHRFTSGSPDYGVRHADDTIERMSFDRIQLEPGELGCDVRLYTSPAL